MAHQVRGRKRAMARHLEARQTPTAASSTAASKSESTTKIVQPTNKIALTTTFTGPTSCAENILTMLPPPGYQIWVNEPVPVANETVAACYPTEYLESYSWVNASSTASSVVPLMSPFVCPRNYCTMMARERNYIACCPSGYQLHAPDAPVDTNRPAYGGTCYSDFAVGTNYPVIAYDAEGDTTSQQFSASTSGAQAYAHPMDGIALTSPTIGCPAYLQSSSSSAGADSASASHSSSSPAAASSSAAAASSSLSPGAIAGISIGGCVGLAFLVGFVWFILAFYRKNRQPPMPPPKVHHMADDFALGKDPNYYRYEAEAGFMGAEISTSQRVPGEKGVFRNSELNDGHGAFEMSADAPVELDAGGKDGAAGTGDGKVRISRLLDNSDKERITRMANWKYNNQ